MRLHRYIQTALKVVAINPWPTDSSNENTRVAERERETLLKDVIGRMREVINWTYRVLSSCSLGQEIPRDFDGMHEHAMGDIFPLLSSSLIFIP